PAAALGGHAGAGILDPQRHDVDNRPADATAHGADLARAFGTCLEVTGGGKHVFDTLGGVELAKKLPGLFVVAGIAADRRESVRREGDEIFYRQASRDILDIRTEAAILVNDDHAG